MDRAKFEKAKEIAKKIDYYVEMIYDLEEVDVIEFLVREEGSQRQVLSLTERWGNNGDLFDVVIGSILTEARNRLKDLKDEFDRL